MKHKSTGAFLLLPFLAMPLARGAESTPPAAAPQGLPLRQVALFSSGVGYFGRSGMVTGDGDIELYFRRDDLNDVLKSLVVSDPSGELQPATYALDELLARRPQTGELPLPAGDSLGGILRNFQGARVEIEANGQTVRGRLIGVSTKTFKDKDGNVTTVETANVLTENGLVVFRLDGLENGGTVRLLDSALSDKLRAQLETRAANLTQIADTGFRPITLHFAGRGARTVKAGYIQATSVWKTSYRLVFDSKNPAANDKTKKPEKSTSVAPLLQGWAVVENTTDEDWKDIQLSLVAGRPVSFVMNLAAPLYVQRPEVPLPFSGAPAPQVYKESLEAQRGPLGPAGPLENRVTKPPALAQRAQGIFANSGNFTDSDRRDIAASAAELMKQQAQADTAEKGELFEYAIRQPVSLKRGEAALVPIVSQAVTADKLSILDAADPALRAVHGLRLRNTTGLHLAGGPITIYEDGLYAGDAQITSIAPGENRLISYALDLDLVIGHDAPTFAQETVGLTAHNGVLTVTHKQRKTEIWTLRNKAAADKTVLVQLPIDPNFKLIAPEKPSEKSPTEYRFEVPVPANDNSQLKVVTERPISETVALLSADINAIVGYTRFGEISPALKTALECVVVRRRKVLELQQQRSSLESQIKEVSDEQNRIRSNMNSLSQNSDLYKRYVAKLDAQETQIEKLRGEVAVLRDRENDAARELRDYVATLNIEG